MDTPKEQEISQENVANLTADEQAEEITPVSESKLSFGHIARVLKRAVAGGNLTPQQAAGMRRDMGINQSYFTRKTISPCKRKRLRKLAKQARKVNAKASHRGRKNTKGKR